MVDVERAGRMGSIKCLGFVWLALSTAACGGEVSRSSRAGGGGASSGGEGTAASTTGTRWARTVVSAPTPSEFSSVAADRSGNVYAAGDFSGPGTLDFGDGVTITGAYASNNALLVKYDPLGTAQWAHTDAALSVGSQFPSVATDSSGNVYAVGYLYPASGEVDFGNGVTFTKSDTFLNAVLVKYDSSGAAQWARAITAGPSDSKFNAVTLDASGNVYVAGAIQGTGTYDFGDHVTAMGTAAGDPNAIPRYGQNVVLVKYDSTGTAQWARTLAAGSLDSSFSSVAVDPAGNVYALGAITGMETYDFGNGMTATGMPIPSQLANPGGADVVVKYDPAGTAQWVQAVTAFFYSVAVDAAGNVYAAGSIGSPTYDFGNGVTAAGTVNSDAGTSLVVPGFVLLVKYDSSGIARWARTVATGGQSSYFESVVADSSGDVYAAGSAWGPGIYDFGNGATVTATTEDGYSGLLVKYDSSGTAEWARSSRNERPSGEVFSSVTVDSLNDVYVAGYVDGTGSVDFGGNVTVTAPQLASSGSSALLVKYQ
jgi:hypothetical protein